MSRDEHLETLRELLASGQLSDVEVEKFGDMLCRLDERPRGELTTKQWEWAKGRHEQLLLGNPAVRNANVPRGREVETPAVLRVLPKRPPGRRTA